MYQDQLPDKPHVQKVNAAISSKSTATPSNAGRVLAFVWPQCARSLHLARGRGHCCPPTVHGCCNAGVCMCCYYVPDHTLACMLAVYQCMQHPHLYPCMCIFNLQTHKMVCQPSSSTISTQTT